MVKFQRFGGYTALALLMIGTAATPSLAGLTGTSLSALYYFPDDGTVYPFASTPGVFVVGPGVEGSINVENVTDIAFDFGDLDLGIVFSTVLSSPTWNNVAFNGIIFSSATPLNLASAHVTGTTMAGFDDSRITISANEIALNWQGLSYVDGTQIDIAFTPLLQAVPEPASWALMVGGLAIAGGALRRGRAKAASIRLS